MTDFLPALTRIHEAMQDYDPGYLNSDDHAHWQKNHDKNWKLRVLLSEADGTPAQWAYQMQYYIDCCAATGPRPTPAEWMALNPFNGEPDAQDQTHQD